MNKREKENQVRMFQALATMGISRDDADALRRISMTLHRWSERECNGEIERDEVTGKTYARYGGDYYAGTCAQRYRTADKETGAQKRLIAIMGRYETLGAYIQGDPRGAALYVFERAKLADRPIDSYYSSVGVAVY